MGWICVTDVCEGHIINGVWDGTGIAFFSIADEIKIIHDVFFNYILTISPTAYLFGFLIMILSLLVSLLVSVKIKMAQNGTR